MASILIAIAVVIAGVLGILAVVDGFRNGDFGGEALARALQKDLEAAAADHDRCPPPRDAPPTTGREGG